MAKTDDSFWWDFFLVVLLVIDAVLNLRAIRDMDRREREWKESLDEPR